MCFLPLLAFCVTAYVSFRGHAVTVGILPYRTGNAEIARDRLPRRLQRLAMTQKVNRSDFDGYGLF